MQLYLEYVIIDNMVMNLILIKFIENTFRVKLRKKNIALSIIIGTILTLFLPYLLKYQILVILYKIVTAGLIVLLLKKYTTIKQYIKYLSIFIIYTFVLGGVVLGIIGLFKIDYSFNGVILYDFEFPISLFVIIFGSTIFLLKKMIIALKEQVQSSNFLCKVILIDGDKKIEATGFMDSGNNVERNGEGVSIISLDLFMKLHDEIDLKKILYQTISQGDLKDMSYIDIRGISGAKKYLSFKVDNLIINDVDMKSQVVAVAVKNFDAFDLIVSNKFIGVNNE